MTGWKSLKSIHKGWYVLLLIISVVMLVLVAVANHAFPQGESYPLSEEECLQMPSPMSNPDWVRFLQDHSTEFIFAGICGFWFAIFGTLGGFPEY